MSETKKKIIPWNGYCPTHARILPEHVSRQKKLHPEAEVIVHPECTPQVIALADKVLSTGGMCIYAKESKSNEIIVGTEVGILYRLRKENPDKAFYPASENAVCPNMKLTTLEKILWSLEDMKYEVRVPEDIGIRAKKAVERMFLI
jgi:quinolinate synthase